jgi:hypothetical protein
MTCTLTFIAILVIGIGLGVLGEMTIEKTKT